MADQVPAVFPVQGQAWRRREAPPMLEVHERVWAAPVPVPGAGIRFVYAYLVVDGDGGATVIDPGWRSPQARRSLSAALERVGTGVHGVRRILVTHNHPDHLGLAGDLARESGASVWLHGDDVASLPSRRGGSRGIEEALYPWLVEHGDDPRPDGLVSDVFGELERPHHHMTDGERIAVGERSLTVVHTPGHTPGHACFVLDGADVLLTGDHLLPRISPNVAGYPSSGPNPLGSFLASLERLVEALPSARTLALPSHEYAFDDVVGRVAQVRHHHDERLAEIMDRICEGPPRTALGISRSLTWSRPWDAITGEMRRAALAETVAHLVYLASLGRVGSQLTGGRRLWHPQTPRSAR